MEKEERDKKVPNLLKKQKQLKLTDGLVTVTTSKADKKPKDEVKKVKKMLIQSTILGWKNQPGRKSNTNHTICLPGLEGQDQGTVEAKKGEGKTEVLEVDTKEVEARDAACAAASSTVYRSPTQPSWRAARRNATSDSPPT